MRHLVIGPGAMAYFAFAGALSALKDLGALNDLEEISGASAGGILAFMYVVSKGDTRRLLDYSLGIPIGDAMRPNIKSLLRSFGLVAVGKIRRHIVGVVREFLGGRTDITFRELYEFWPVKLYVSACCVETSTTHYFSVDSSPGMSVVDALCMTVAVPFLFESVSHGPWHYIDGGVLEETPCNPFIGRDSVCVIRMDTCPPCADVKDLKAYVTKMLGCVMGLRGQYRMFPTILLSVDDIFDFKASRVSKMKMFVQAYLSCTNNPPRFSTDRAQMPESEQHTDPSHLGPEYVSEVRDQQTDTDREVLQSHYRPDSMHPRIEDTDVSESVGYSDAS